MQPIFTKLKNGPSSKLRAKFTLAFTWTAVLTVLVVEIILICIALVILNFYLPNVVLNDLRQKAIEAGPFFMHGSPNKEEVGNWLQIIKVDPFMPDPGRSNLVFLRLVDSAGKEISSVTTPALQTDYQVPPISTYGEEAGLQSVLSDPKGTTSWATQNPDGTLVAIAPVLDKAGELRGAIVSKIKSPSFLQIFLRFLVFIVGSMVVVTAIAALAGLLFGYRTARGLTRRLERLSVAADRWSEGDFSVLVKDSSNDELGQVATQLNQMAGQLQNLLTAREKLATLEERNRLARDLHDSVKQQIFAVGMQLGATKYLLKSEPAAAEARLNEAQQLVSQAQEELTSLILELRPVALEGKGLVTALQKLSAEWASQSGIEANLRVEGTQPLTSAVEEALYRVAQEALSNAARHSWASEVQIILELGGSEVRLIISDNGLGFSPSAKEISRGVGLLSMKERMKALGGEVRIEGEPGKGTRLEVHCPRMGLAEKVLQVTEANSLILNNN